jgi:hypothetical protein
MSILSPVIAGDQITAPVWIKMRIEFVEAASISESATYELQYVPEPSANLMLPSGIGALMMLSKVRGK